MKMNAETRVWLERIDTELQRMAIMLYRRLPLRAVEIRVDNLRKAIYDAIHESVSSELFRKRLPVNFAFWRAR